MIVLTAIVGLVATACAGGRTDSAVASLDDIDSSSNSADADDDSPEPADTEQVLLDLAACMRAEGVDVGDPQIGSDGNFRLGQIIRQVSSADPDEIRAAMAACSEHVEGLTLGFQDIDLTELQDQMLDFAACMRDNDFDMPDPDFSNFGNPGQGARGVFDFDPQDVGFQNALEQCQDILSFGRFGQPGSGRSGGSG